MARKCLYVLMVVVLTAGAAGSVRAGGEKGQAGISLTAAEVTPMFMGRFWVSDNVTLEPELGITQVSLGDSDDGDATRFIPGLGLAFHLRPGQEFRPYFGFRFNFDMLSANDETYTDVAMGLVFGGEYFFDRHFSVSGEYQMAIVMTDEDISPSFFPIDATIMQSTQLLGVNFYF